MRRFVRVSLSAAARTRRGDSVQYVGVAAARSARHRATLPQPGLRVEYDY